MGRLIDRIRLWAWEPAAAFGGGSYTTFSRLARKIVRILLITAYGFEKNQLSLRASALTYTVILSLIPLLAMSTAVLKGLGADDQMKAMVYRMLDQLAEQTRSGPALKVKPGGGTGEETGDVEKMGDKEAGSEKEGPKGGVLKAAEGAAEAAVESAIEEAVSETNDTKGPSEGARGSGSDEAGGGTRGSIAHLKLAVDKIFDYVERTNFAALGWFGILGVIYTVIMLMSHIEEALNAIWATDEARDLGRKVIDYLALIILLPLSINVAFWGMAALQNEKFIAKVASFFKVSWVLPILFKFLPALLVVGTFAILYRFMPNTRVKVLPATVGGFIGGVGWIVMQAVYVKLQIGVARYNAIYGSFATLPLFIFWLYLSWIIFLVGAQASYAIQNHRSLNLFEKVWKPVLYLALCLDIMNSLFKAVDRARPMGALDLAEEVRRPLDKVHDAISILIKAGLVAEARTENLPGASGDERYLPVVSRQRLKNSVILTAVFGTIDDECDTKGSRLTKSAMAEAAKKIDEQRL